MVYRRKDTGASSSGFVCANKGDGTNNWMPTPLRVSSISSLMKLKMNWPMAFFVSGLPTNEVRRHPAIPGTPPGVAV